MAVINDEVKVARPHWVGGYVLTNPNRIVTAETFHRGGTAGIAGDTSRGRGGRGESVYHGAICGNSAMFRKRLARIVGRLAPLNFLSLADSGPDSAELWADRPDFGTTGLPMTARPPADPGTESVTAAGIRPPRCPSRRRRPEAET